MVRSIIISIFVSLLPATTVVAFVPSHNKNHIREGLRSTFNKPDMDGTIDIDHAKYCADHFGECSLDEIDRIRNGKCAWMELFCIAISTPIYLMHSSSIHIIVCSSCTLYKQHFIKNECHTCSLTLMDYKTRMDSRRTLNIRYLKTH